MEHTPCWIWYPGDFELRHSLKLHARRQERELRQWLYGETADQATLTAALAGEAADVEDVHGVAVDLVTVGDCELTPDLAALVEYLARELPPG